MDIKLDIVIGSLNERSLSATLDDPLHDNCRPAGMLEMAVETCQAPPIE